MNSVNNAIRVVLRAYNMSRIDIETAANTILTTTNNSVRMNSASFWYGVFFGWLLTIFFTIL